MFYRFANLVLRLFFYLLTRLEITGRDNVPPTGSLMVVLNHVSFLDPPLLGVGIPRRIWWMSKIENWNNPIMGVVLTLYGAFPVQRGEVDRKALVHAMDILRTGGALGIAPEGTRSRSGILARAKPGAARLALQTDATILPVGIVGTERAVQAWRRLRRPVISLHIGKPFKLAAEKPVSKEKQQELADSMTLHIAELLPEKQRGVYAGGAGGPKLADEVVR
ncbi:MAG: lysophospholipid acyltransferase family protein [Chloroflexota bacterium]|nr:lysophospholipid acyltransferase family protein [Chloroflexota bacterium]